MQISDANAEFLNGYFSTHHRSQKTKMAYSSDLAQFQAFVGADLGLLSFSGAVIERWAAYLRQEKYAPASIRRKMAILKVFCAYWVRKGVLPESPFWRVKLSFGRVEQLPRSLTRREMRKLLAQGRRGCPPIHGAESGELLVTIPPVQTPSRDYRALRNLALVDLLFATGMRVGEVSSLDVRDYLAREKVFR